MSRPVADDDHVTLLLTMFTEIPYHWHEPYLHITHSSGDAQVDEVLWYLKTAPITFYPA